MNVQRIIQRFWHEQPIVFPLVALFHIFLLGRYIIDLWGNFGDRQVVLGGLWFTVAAVLSVYIAFMKRWANIGYSALTIAGLLLQYLIPIDSEWRPLGITLFPFDVLMCVFLLFYYKRFR
jgi:hypothetical protein